MLTVRLIDADAALALIKQLRNKDKNNYLRLYACNFAMSTLGNPEQTPTINPEDIIPQGRWEFDSYTAKYGNPYRCSQCKEEHDDTHNYCPNCGAKMAGDGNA